MSFETSNFPHVIPRAYVASGDETLPNNCDASGNLNVAIGAAVEIDDSTPIDVNVTGTVGLTDAELRATPVPVSGAVTVGSVAADTAAQSTVSVGTSSTLLVAANANRTSLVMYNAGSNTIFFGPTGVTTSTGIPIAAGGIFTWGKDEDNTAIYGVVAAATEDMIVREIDNA